jgi:micrococcal nuclease
MELIIFIIYRAPDGLFVNLELIRLGYARVYEYDHAQAGLFKNYETRAKEAKKGLWNPLQRGQAAKPAASSAPETGAAKAEAAGGQQGGTGAIATTAASNGADAGTVYVTKSGKKYHRAGCRSLSKSSIPMALATAKARGMQPCSVCKP